VPPPNVCPFDTVGAAPKSAWWYASGMSAIQKRTSGASARPIEYAEASTFSVTRLVSPGESACIFSVKAAPGSLSWGGFAASVLASFSVNVPGWFQSLSIK
jgi:hypothetical protein